MSSYLETCLLGIVVIGLLWIKVPNRYMLPPISAFAVILLLSPFSISHFNMEAWVYYTLVGIGGVGLLTTYSVRFRQISPKRGVHYFKLSAIVVAALCIPLTWFYMSDIPAVVGICYVIAAYFYDRIVLSFENGKRGYIIALSIQSVLVVLMLVFALVQRTTAIKSREELYGARQDAQQARVIAEQNEMKAMAAEQEAIKQAELANKALEECRRSK
jgi:hypothetical protein